MSEWQKIYDRLGLTLKPIQNWPQKEPYNCERSPFSAPFGDTLTILERELRHLSARNIVLQIPLKERDFRLDGLPRMDARIGSDPRIILAFDSRHGTLRIYFGRFANWQHNLRAIALHLENLRHASLYGVGRDGQQYTGWKALPAAGQASGDFQTVEAAVRWLAAQSGLWFDSHIAQAVEGILKDKSMMNEAYRAAARKLHPDAGGDHAQFVQLQRAKEILESHHGRSEK